MIRFLAGLTVAAITLAGGTAWALQDARDLGPMLQTLNDVLSLGRSNVTMNYESSATGNRGKVTAIEPVGPRDDQPCWSFERVYGSAGGQKTVEGIACRSPDGFWEIKEERGVTRPAVSGAGPVTRPMTPPLSTYDRSMVLEVQQSLATLGYDPGPSDGLYGRRTGNAIAAYQTANGLPVDRVPSESLIVHLRGSLATSATTDRPWLNQDPAPAQATTPTPAPAAPAAPTAPAPAPAQIGPGQNVASADLAAQPASFLGRSVRTTGIYLHYSGAWAKLLASDDVGADYVYLQLDAIDEATRAALRADCFLCAVRVEGRIEQRMLTLGGAALGEEPALIVTSIERLE